MFDDTFIHVTEHTHMCTWKSLRSIIIGSNSIKKNESRYEIRSNGHRKFSMARGENEIIRFSFHSFFFSHQKENERRQLAPVFVGLYVEYMSIFDTGISLSVAFR